MTRQITTRISGVDRGKNTRDGNPQYTVFTDDGAFLTSRDGAVAYGIGNSEYRGPVVLTVEGNHVVGAATLNGEHFIGRQG